MLSEAWILKYVLEQAHWLLCNSNAYLQGPETKNTKNKQRNGIKLPSHACHPVKGKIDMKKCKGKYWNNKKTKQ